MSENTRLNEEVEGIQVFFQCMFNQLSKDYQDIFDGLDELKKTLSEVNNGNRK